MWIFNQTRLFSLWHENFRKEVTQIYTCQYYAFIIIHDTFNIPQEVKQLFSHLFFLFRFHFFNLKYDPMERKKKKHCGWFEKVSRISLMCYWAHIVPLIVFTDNWNLHRSCQWHALVKIMWRWYCHNLVTIKSLLSYLSYFHNQITDFHNVHYIKDELLTDIWPHIN